MKREDIKGFTLKVFKYYIEFVFIRYLLKSVVVSRGLKKNLIRVEI